MFSKERLDAFAKVLVWGLKTARIGEFKPFDTVLVSFSRLYFQLAEIVQAILLQEGINVLLEMFPTPVMEKNRYLLSNDDQLKFLPQWEKDKHAGINGTIQILAPEDLTHLKDVDPQRIAMFASSKMPIRQIRDEREALGVFGWTLCVPPTQALADASNMTLKEYEDEVAKICHLDDTEPLEFWENLYKESLIVKEYLNHLDVDYFHICSDSGRTDLIINPGEARRWIGISGHNVPSFELFTSPDCRETVGTFYANTVMFKDGNKVSGVYLRFDNGRIVEASAEEGNDFLQAQIKLDETADMLGEFSLTDKKASSITKFMSHILYDENVGGENGNCHIAIGNGFPDAYCGEDELTPERRKEIGLNQSAQHWDLISTEKKTVFAILKNGEEITVYQDGSFVIPEPAMC